MRLEVEASQVGLHVLVEGESIEAIFTGRVAGVSPMGELGQLVVRGRGPPADIVLHLILFETTPRPSRRHWDGQLLVRDGVEDRQDFVALRSPRPAGPRCAPRFAVVLASSGPDRRARTPTPHPPQAAVGFL